MDVNIVYWQMTLINTIINTNQEHLQPIRQRCKHSSTQSPSTSVFKSICSHVNITVVTKEISSSPELL